MESIQSTSPLLFDYFARSNSKHINYLLQQGIINPSDIDTAIESWVIKQARKDYQHLQRLKHDGGSVEALHHCIPEYLAYALEKPGVFSAQEIATIDFEDARSKEQFCEEYRQPNLIEKLRTRLINPPKPITFHDDVLTCGDGGPCTC